LKRTRRWNQFVRNSLKVLTDVHVLIGTLLAVVIALMGFWQIVTRAAH
jgi:uncharacterized membrane protein